MRGFLSYRRKNNFTGHITRIHELLVRYLSQEMEVDRLIDIYFDVDDAEPTGVTEKLKKNIEDSDFFVAMITNAYCEARSVAASEFLYFHELMKSAPAGQKKLIPIVYSDLDNEAQQSNIWRISSDTQYYDFRRIWRDQGEGALDQAVSPLAVGVAKSFRGGEVATSDEIQQANNIEGWLNRIKAEVFDTNEHIEFRDHLIGEILKSVHDEISALNKVEYRHNISLDLNFIIRASAIFRPAVSVNAVSVDSSSSFWLNSATKSLAQAYTKEQPRQTNRLFVFSNPASMLKHRWVLHAHNTQYEDGRVLITSLARWKEYLKTRGIGLLGDGGHEDFGILKYSLGKVFLATLSQADLSFKRISGDDPHLVIVDDFARAAEVSAHPDGEVHTIDVIDNMKTFWLWRDIYGYPEDSKAWHRCVADVFDQDIDFGPTYNSEVMHSVLIAPINNDEVDFERFMKGVIDSLLNIKGTDEVELIKSIWFGRVAKHPESDVVDPIHHHPVLFPKAINARWKYCLTMSFKSPKDCHTYYEHPDHAVLRRRFYEFLEPKVTQLYEKEESWHKENETAGSSLLQWSTSVGHARR